MNQIFSVLLKAFVGLLLTNVIMFFVSNSIEISEQHRKNIARLEYDDRLCKAMKKQVQDLTELGTEHSTSISEACARVKLGVHWTMALDSTIRKLHWCGTHPCQDIWESMTSSWKGILFMILFPVVVYQAWWTLYGKFLVVLEKRRERKLRKAQERDAFANTPMKDVVYSS